MRVLIAYSSKHGTTAKCARILAEKLGSAEVDIKDINCESVDSPDNYDVVVLGSSVRMGTISKNIKKYIKDYNQWDDSIIKFIDRDLVITLLEENSTNFIARISRPYSFNQRLKTGKKLDSCLELQKSVLADTKLHVIKKDLNNMILSMDDLIKLAKCDERVKAAVKSLIKSNLENEDSDSGEKI